VDSSARGGLEPRFRVLFSAIFHGVPSEIAIRVKNRGFWWKQNCCKLLQVQLRFFDALYAAEALKSLVAFLGRFSARDAKYRPKPFVPCEYFVGNVVDSRSMLWARMLTLAHRLQPWPASSATLASLLSRLCVRFQRGRCLSVNTIRKILRPGGHSVMPDRGSRLSRGSKPRCQTYKDDFPKNPSRLRVLRGRPPYRKALGGILIVAARENGRER
jgi:hypothetical protein